MTKPRSFGADAHYAHCGHRCIALIETLRAAHTAVHTAHTAPSPNTELGTKPAIVGTTSTCPPPPRGIVITTHPSEIRVSRLVL
eukprot:IDg8331t1